MSQLINEQSIPILLKEMTVEEKIDLLVGKSAFSTQELPQYGIPSIRYLDGATGVNMLQYVMELMGAIMRSDEKKDEVKEVPEDNESNNESGAGAMDFMKYVVTDIPIPEAFPAPVKELLESIREKVQAIRPAGEEPGCFPPGMLLGATWNPKRVYQVAEAVAREAMAYDVDVLLGTPNTNIHRDPKNGRVFESFSEDPYLSKTLAPAFVKGVQDQGMVADVKHFAANNQETLRQGINEIISERTLREIYLPGFEAAVKEGKVSTVMSAYNSINGVACAQNNWLLMQVLKEEWGFDGVVVSDWGAVYDQVEALNAGNDLDMPGPRGKARIHQAVAEGTISMERLDDAVSRCLKVILKSPKFIGKKYTTIDNELSKKAAYEAAIEGITLLKNEGILPLKPNTKVALFGKRTTRFMESGSGSAQVDTSKTTSLPVEVARYTDSVFTDCIEDETEVVIITAGASGQEGADRPDMDFDAEDKEILKNSIALAKKAEKKIILLLNVAGPVELAEYVDDVDALVCLFFPGMEGARATADILFGAASPSGKLPITFPKTYRQTPTAINFPGEFGQVVYGEGVFVGYRYYDYKDIAPLYPFGYGLGYSDFSISDVTLSEKLYDNRSTKPLSVTVRVKNTGCMEAKEVVQLYIHSVKATRLKPEQELKGFVKVSLLPGEEKVVTMELYPKDFASYDVQFGKWIAEPGEYELRIGNSSRNIMTKGKVQIEGANPYGCSLYTSIAQIAKNDTALQICQNILGTAFNIGTLKSNVTYFGSTPLKEYLQKRLKGIDKSSKDWEVLLEQLGTKLEELG